jgi:hypothetical protein
MIDRLPALSRPIGLHLNAFRQACALLLGVAALAAPAQVVQTNFGSGTESLPGDIALSSTDLLQTQLTSATRSASGDGAFYREESGYDVVLSRLSDGQFGAFGGYSNYTVMPNDVAITFVFDTTVNTLGYSLSSIRTFASWDDGRDGQRYEVQYATVDNPTDFLSLYVISAYDNTDFPTRWEYDYDLDEEVEVTDTDISNTLVQLTAAGGVLAENVAALRFVFDGYENSGTAYREFDVLGAATVSAVPEPSAYAALLGGGALIGTVLIRRRRAA